MLCGSKEITIIGSGIHVSIFGFRTYLPGIESVVPGEEQLSHSHCTGLCISSPCQAAALSITIPFKKHEFCPYMIESYSCDGFTQCQANRSWNRKGLYFCFLVRIIQYIINVWARKTIKMTKTGWWYILQNNPTFSWYYSSVTQHKQVR